jgi:transcriptional antiterminator RfaH
MHATARWYLIHTHPKQEQRVDNNLRCMGIETYTPMIRESNGRRATACSCALFPRYMFARFILASMLHNVRYTRGVQSVVAFGGTCTPVEDDVIAFCRTLVTDDGYLTIPPATDGDEVIITGGPLRDLIGLYDRRLSGAQRVTILLTAVNYQARVTVHPYQIRRAP